MSVTSLKEEGNERFKAGNYEGAISRYTEALYLGDMKDSDKATIHKNRAMCHLKLEEYDDAVKDASDALEIIPNDPKALYRRCVANESLGKLEEAYKDCAMLVKIDPKNTSVKPILNRLTPIIRERVKKQGSTQDKVSQMFNLVFDSTGAKEKRLQATNNLIVLAREQGGPSIIMQQNGMTKIKDLLFTEKDTDLLQAATRVLACLTVNDKPRSMMAYEDIGVVRLGQLMAMPVEGISTSVALVLQNLISSITELHVYKDLRDKYDTKRRQGDPAIPPKFQMDEYQQKFLQEVFTGLIKMLQHIKVSASGRDAAMELMIKMITRKTGVHWSNKFLDTEGIDGLLLITGAVSAHGTLPVSTLSKMHASLLLNTVWEDLLGEKEVDKFKAKVSDFFKDLFSIEDMESKVEAVRAISMLLQGPFEVGNMMLGFEGVTQIMLALAQSDRALHQQIAVECIVHSASKKDKCTGLLADAVPTLKKLYHDGLNDSIKVRALVGLCKLGSFEGSDASSRPMADGSTVTLAKACRRFLSNPSNDLDMKQWGTEGLAYLTLDADVKEELVHDPESLQAVMQAAKDPSPSFMYAAATLFVNMTNSSDKQEMVPEMVELAKFSKQHVPEQHAKDKEEFVKVRVEKLVKAGLLQVLMILSKSTSKNTKEQVSRVYITVGTDEKYRGQIVQAGGIKTLLNLFTDNNTELGKQVASQTLAKIAITTDPNISFTGQRMYEVVRPLISLLHVERSGLQNFEALLALTNLSSISDSCRQRIWSERGVPSIEHYMYEEHEMIQRAAIECMSNMVMHERVAKLFEGDNDRVKFFFLMCGDEDEKIVRAVSGALAVLTANSLIVCKKILEVPKWTELLLSVVVSETADIQHRGCYLLQNLVQSDKEVAEKVLAGQLMEVLMAITILEAPDRQNARNCALETLKQAEEFDIIKKNPSKS